MVVVVVHHVAVLTSLDNVVGPVVNVVGHANHPVRDGFHDRQVETFHCRGQAEDLSIIVNLVNVVGVALQLNGVLGAVFVDQLDHLALSLVVIRAISVTVKVKRDFRYFFFDDIDCLDQVGQPLFRGNPGDGDDLAEGSLAFRDPFGFQCRVRDNPNWNGEGLGGRLEALDDVVGLTLSGGDDRRVVVDVVQRILVVVVKNRRQWLLRIPRLGVVQVHDRVSWPLQAGQRAVGQQRPVEDEGILPSGVNLVQEELEQLVHRSKLVNHPVAVGQPPARPDELLIVINRVLVEGPDSGVTIGSHPLFVIDLIIRRVPLDQ